MKKMRNGFRIKNEGLRMKKMRNGLRMKKSRNGFRIRRKGYKRTSLKLTSYVPHFKFST